MKSQDKLFLQKMVQMNQQENNLYLDLQQLHTKNYQKEQKVLTKYQIKIPSVNTTKKNAKLQLQDIKDQIHNFNQKLKNLSTEAIAQQIAQQQQQMNTQMKAPPNLKMGKSKSQKKITFKLSPETPNLRQQLPKLQPISRSHRELDQQNIRYLDKFNEWNTQLQQPTRRHSLKVEKKAYFNKMSLMKGYNIEDVKYQQIFQHKNDSRNISEDGQSQRNNKISF